MNVLKKEQKIIDTSASRVKAELVFKNASYLNVFTNSFVKADVAICCGTIVGVGEYSGETEIDCTGKTLVPGFVDSHIHLESSIITPQNFAKAVAPHGTTAVVTDPHEITNVMGYDGFDYMLEATENLPIDVYFTVPSCVPATQFDENGAKITVNEVQKYIMNPRVLGLAEMMNFPAVCNGDAAVLQMIEAAQLSGKVVDGHAPQLNGKQLNAYIAAGVNSDHECTELCEAYEKLSLGQYIMIRQGTAGKNLEALLPLLKGETYTRCLFATDDKHPGELAINGHIDYIIRKAILSGVRPEIAYKVASFNACEYFGLKHRGAIAPGYRADFVLLDDINSVKISAVYKNGAKLKFPLDIACENVNPKLKDKALNTMHVNKITPSSLKTKKPLEKVIGLIGGEIITTDEGEASKIDIKQDVLKACVVERHKNTGHIGICYVKGYGLKSGAVATSVAHDSHNIIAIGASDSDISAAVNSIIEMGGGMVVVNDGEVLESLQLNIAGLMTEQSLESVVENMNALKEAASLLGVGDNIDPFMTLSFISLPVIPSLKLTSLGVVDVNKFQLLD